jgi:ribosomal protein S18 acetylase RimI-like enzyme
MPAPRLRPFTLDDTDATHEVAERYFQAGYGHGTYFTPDIIRSQLDRPGVIADLDLSAVELDRRLVAAAFVVAREPFQEIRLGVVVEPELEDHALAQCMQLLIDRFDEATRARLPDRASAEDAEQAIEVPPTLPRLGATLRDHGFAVGRSVYEMVIDLSDGYPAPTWPDGFTRRSPTLEPADVASFSTVFTQSFVDHPGDDFSQEEIGHALSLPTTSLPLSMLVDDEQGPVGLILTMVEEEGGYVGGLGVLARARRRGLGSALLRQTFADLSAQGVTLCRLHVEAVNPNAVALYQQVGMTVESTTDIWLRPAHR